MIKPVIVGEARCIGHILPTCRGFRALAAPDDREIGVFDSEHAAAHALAAEAST